MIFCLLSNLKPFLEKFSNIHGCSGGAGSCLLPPQAESSEKVTLIKTFN